MFSPNHLQKPIPTAVEVAVRAVRPYPEMVELLFKNGDALSASLMHAGVGICGEAGELVVADATNDYENMREELGDMRFYMQKLFNVFSWSLETFAEFDYRDALLEGGSVPKLAPSFLCAVSIQVVGSDVLDALKKSWVYNKDLDEAALFDHMGKLVSLYNEMIMQYGFTDEQVQDANRDKLSKRYPEGVYSDADAVARADKAMSNPAIEGNPPFIITGASA